MAREPALNTIHVKILSKLGSGSTGIVWRATSDIPGTTFIALKQSRASVRLKKPLLEYEACVLEFLQGHVSIPKFYAYGRPEHFEFLALELLGSNLGRLFHNEHPGRFSLGTVLKIAEQMLSALCYLHGKGIVHRDIKPCNILVSLEDRQQLKIVDFAFAGHIDSDHCKRIVRDDASVFGTLTWASIRSHEGYQLSRRDDLESLAYILLAFIQGGLPWRHYHGHHIFNAANQVLHKKRNWPGARLGRGLPPCFGNFLDYARELSYDQIPDYQGWAQTFNNLAESYNLDRNRPFDWTIETAVQIPTGGVVQTLCATASSSAPDEHLPTLNYLPVELGQIVYLQILARPTLELLKPFHDPSYWHDPELSTNPLLQGMDLVPGIVVYLGPLDPHTELTRWVHVLPIQRGKTPDLMFVRDKLRRIVSHSSLKVNDYDIVLPDWPFEDTFCCGYPHPIRLTFFSTTEAVHPYWKITAQEAARLEDDFLSINTIFVSIEERVGILKSYTILAKPYPLTPQTVVKCGNLSPNWTTKQGWHDDIERMSRMYYKKDGCKHAPWEDPELEKSCYAWESYFREPTGYILARRGILDKKTQKQINHLNVSLFTPALLFSKVAFFLSPEKLGELWIVPIFFVLVTVVSTLVAYGLSLFLGLKKSQRCFAMAAAMFMNSNSLPIALMQSLVVSGVPGLKWGAHDSKNAMIGRALTYLVLYSTLGMVVRWSIGVQLLSQADDEVPTIQSRQETIEHDLPHVESTSTFVVDSNTLLRPPPQRRTTYYRSFPNSPDQEETQLPSSETPSNQSTPALTPYLYTFAGSPSASDTDLPLPLHDHSQSPPPDTQLPPSQLHHYHHRHQPKSIIQRLVRILQRINTFMTPPLWAALLSIIVACIRPVQHMLEVHLLSVKGALGQAGNCSIPLTLVVLGAYFHTPKEQGQEQEGSGLRKGKGKMPMNGNGTTNGNENGGTHRDPRWTVRRLLGLQQPIMLPPDTESSLTTPTTYTSEGVTGREDHLTERENEHQGGERRQQGDEPREGETKTVWIAVLSRMILTPLLLMPLLVLSAKYDWHRVFEDPIFVICSVLLVSSPTAVTLAQITQAASGDAFERLISRTIFWSYCVLTPPATIGFVVLGMVLTKV
ncbi:hypothetical protein H0H93_005689 [Arthromyces matolae]|nr:hypothetical protein H0H93_005689 [Arthromyces matolae]